jgi:2-dehydro-3-deoxygluconokinase
MTDAPTVVLTMGNEGAMAVAEDGSPLFQPALRVDIVDRIGAGDAFSSGVLCGLLEGSLAAGLRYGTAIAAHKLTTIGDIFQGNRAEVLALLDQDGDGRPSR